MQDVPIEQDWKDGGHRNSGRTFNLGGRAWMAHLEPTFKSGAHTLRPQLPGLDY